MHIENYISYTHTHIFAKDQTQSTLSFSPSHILPSPNQRPPDVEGRALIRDPAVNICESTNLLLLLPIAVLARRVDTAGIPYGKPLELRKRPRLIGLLSRVTLVVGKI